MTAEGEGPCQPPTEFTLQDGTVISEYFAERNRKLKVTRGELADLLQIFPSKADLVDAIQAVSFNLRAAVRKAVEEERAKEAAEPESRLILP